MRHMKSHGKKVANFYRFCWRWHIGCAQIQLTTLNRSAEELGKMVNREKLRIEHGGTISTARHGLGISRFAFSAIFNFLFGAFELESCNKWYRLYIAWFRPRHLSFHGTNLWWCFVDWVGTKINVARCDWNGLWVFSLWFLSIIKFID